MKSILRFHIKNSNTFFNKYPLYTIKSLDFEDWKTLISMSDTKEYKTVVGKKNDSHI